MMELREWFHVEFDEAKIWLKVAPPQRAFWEATLEWSSINRICFNAGSLDTPDEIYIFTENRPESYLIPTEAKGGDELWDEIVRRKLFDAEIAIKAMQATNELVCCPPIEAS